MRGSWKEPKFNEIIPCSLLVADKHTTRSFARYHNISALPGLFMSTIEPPTTRRRSVTLNFQRPHNSLCLSLLQSFFQFLSSFRTLSTFSQQFVELQIHSSSFAPLFILFIHLIYFPPSIISNSGIANNGERARCSPGTARTPMA